MFGLYQHYHGLLCCFTVFKFPFGIWYPNHRVQFFLAANWIYLRLSLTETSPFLLIFSNFNDILASFFKIHSRFNIFFLPSSFSSNTLTPLWWGLHFCQVSSTWPLEMMSHCRWLSPIWGSGSWLLSWVARVVIVELRSREVWRHASICSAWIIKPIPSGYKSLLLRG